MVIGRVARRSARADHVKAIVGEADAQAALDLLELVEFGWHDCYGEITPPDAVIDDILVCSRGDLARMIRAARLAVEDFRDLRLAADAIRAGSAR
ncbi:MAG TPA: hypothetical protein VFQ44_06070 [Streptosporangiaceae bacterium]|nr:hypothetical protein [Streptosporangiaceae bacterium]